MTIPLGMIDEIIKSMREVVKNELVMLWGVKDEFLKLNKKLGKIKCVLHDAENKEFQDQAIREWLVELKDLMYDIEDIIDDCYIDINNTTTTNNTTSPPRSRPSCFCSTTTSFKKGKRMISKKISAFYKKGKAVVHRHEIGKRIQEINVRLEEINKARKELQLVETVQIEGFIPPPPTSQRSRETTSYVIDSDITGIDEDVKVMVQKLTGSFGGGGGGRGGRVFAIVGMGGIGKTTLAQKVFNECTEVGKKIWVCVSQNFNEIDILKQIIRSADGNYGEAQTKQEFYSIMKKELGGKRFFLVLDDLWGDRVWDDCLRIPFSDFTEDCQVLITTRNREIARQMKAVYIHEMKKLSDDDAWSLLCKIVHIDGETEEIDPSIQDLGMKIVKECKGLPLAIKAIGGVLNKKERKKDAWEIVMKSFYKLSSSEVLPALRLSYMDLPSYLKPCFLYCSLFPEDHRISRADITRMWMAEGFVIAEGIDVAEAYHEELIARNLLQVVDVNRYYEEQDFLMDLRCKMHDLVRDMVISMTQGEHIFGRPQQHTEGASLKPRRLSIISGDEDEDALELKEIPLRSLLVFNGPWTRREIQGDLFDKLKYLRVVNLRRTFIKRLPDSIGKLIQLRYLDLSGTEIAELPDSLCNLQNLQTLFLRGCRNLTKLPKDLPHLKELQHICVSQSEYTGEADVMMPAGTGELVKLQTLDSFTIYDIGHNNDDEVGCNIHELGSLSHLKYLRIQRLERVQSGAEAKKAMIQNKIHLRSLGLWWIKRDLEYSSRIDIPPEEVKMKQMEEVFEEFRPPSSLQVLDVYGFGGRELPSWMMPTSNFLDNLLYLELCKVKFITRLPSLGHLPQLKKLRVVDNQGVVSIGPEFLFGETERRGRGIFPKLEFLLFEWMKVWEEWSDGMERKEGKSRVTKIGDAGGGGKSLDILPRLRKLRLNSCFRLRTLPGCLVHVRELTLLNCYTLEYLWNLLALQSLNVVNCGALKDMTNLGASSLTQISFRFYYDVSVENNMEALRSVKITDETLLIIHGPPGFASKCSVEDGPYTPIIHRFPRVQVFEDIKHIFSYTQSTSETRIQPT